MIAYFVPVIEHGVNFIPTNVFVGSHVLGDDVLSSPQASSIEDGKSIGIH